MIWVLAAACGQQSPSFQEHRDSRGYEEGDATARGRGGALPRESDDARANGGKGDAGVGAGGQAGGSAADGVAGAADGVGGSGAAGDGMVAGGGGGGGSTADGLNGGASGNDAGSDSNGGNDSGIPGGEDALGDWGSDSGSDSGSDAAGSDAGSDAAGSDAGSDATGSDAGSDAAGSDAGSDAAGSDAGSDTGSIAGAGSDSGSEDGIGGARRTVEVVQGAPAKVDMLWIVDVSGSMAEEQQYLGQNFNALINQLVGAGHSFQLGITTTDICDSQVPDDLSQRVCPVEYGGDATTHLRGSFVGQAGRKVLKSSDSDIIQKFNEYTAQGVDGSGFEHGMKAAHLALEKVLAGQNEALLRDDAFLSVIVVSDEQDDGIGLSQTDAYHGHNFFEEGLTTFRYTEDDMIGYLQGLKGAGKFSISAITPTRNADGTLCSAPHTAPKEEGTQYIEAAEKSGGIIQSLCDTNWSQSLAKIGMDIAAQTSQIELPSVPDKATIKVYVNGVLTTQWTYNAGNNAVKFNAGHVPPEGAVMKVTYYEP
jgi:hypothetical protein